MRCLLSAIVLWSATTMSLHANQVVEPKMSPNVIPLKQGTPHEINYQGWLGSATDTTGVTDTLGMIFRLYTTPTGGSPVWNEAHIAVPVDKGIFNVYLGEVTALPPNIFTGGALWLEIQVMNDTLSPRKKLVSVGYAIKSEKADTASYALGANVQYVDSAGVSANSWKWNNITWGVDYPKSDKSDTALYVTGANVSGEVANANRADTADYATGAAPHDHINQSWSTTTGTYGLRKKIDVNTASNIYCAVDSALNAGTGDAYGGRFYASGTGTGYKYGTYGYASAPAASSSSAYGNYGDANHSGTGNVFGGRFYAGGTGTGYRYGTYSSASAPSTSSVFACGIYAWSAHEGTGEAFGGRFSASGAGTGTKYGVYAFTGGSGTRYAGYFSGDVNVTGALSKGSGSFLIDHPVDPMNKTLRHNFVESPENLCLYRGKVKLDANGEAVVDMPGYFVALTKESEATVNLTPVGKPFQVGYEWQTGNTKFTVYGEPNREISYIVLADRDDPVMRKLVKPVEEDKGDGKICERGELLYPDAYGYPKELGRDYKLQKEAEDIRREPKPELHKPDVEPIK